MRYTEGNRRRLSEESPPPSPVISCEDELNRSSSGASTLPAEHRSMSTKWTDEKHSLYLETLEVSFVKQLHKSIGLLRQCSNQNKRGNNSTVMHPINVDNASEKFNYYRGDPLSNVSPDSLSPIKSPRVYRSKRIWMHTPAASTYMPGHLTLCDTENHSEVVASRGLDTCSQQCSDSSHDDSHFLTREGTDQNFVDEDYQTKTYSGSRVKRLKTALPNQS